MILSLTGVVALAATGVWAGDASAVPGDGVLDTVLVSRASGTAGAAADGSSFDASTSADGRYVAFESNADNLDPDSNDAVSDIFVRDTVTGTTTLVSRADGVAGAAGDGDSRLPSISADGRYVAFQSNADNLDPDSDDVVGDVFVRDTVSGTTTLVSRDTGVAGAAADGDSGSPSISADGRTVAFDSSADNLAPDDADTVGDVFVRDTVGGTTTLVSRADGAAGVGGDDGSFDPSISADGRTVAFISFAGNLDADSDDAVVDVFVRDTVAGTTTLASRAAGAAGAVGDESSTGASISADGRAVAFTSSADNLDPDSNDAVSDVFVRDTVAGTTTLVSRASGVAGAVGDGASSAASISADGRTVAFSSSADNLDPDSDDAFHDVFARDTVSGTTTLVSRASGAAGAAGDGGSVSPAIAGDGRTVAFDSLAGNLDPDSDDAVNDVFARELADPVPPPGVTSPPTSPPAAASAEDPKCERLRRKLRRQARGLELAGAPRKRALIKNNRADTRKRLRKLRCR